MTIEQGLRSVLKAKTAEIERLRGFEAANKMNAAQVAALRARIAQLEAALRDVCGLEVYGFAITGPDGKDVVCEGTNRFVRETDFKAVRKIARAALKERT